MRHALQATQQKNLLTARRQALQRPSHQRQLAPRGDFGKRLGAFAGDLVQVSHAFVMLPPRATAAGVVDDQVAGNAK
ncbi:hypothetical protein D3C80_1952220 [compost metagenome]